MTASPVRVLFIAGTGRCGSTILSSILGQVPGLFSAGELRYIWTRGMVEDHRCGCGRPFHECDVWTSVCKEAFKGSPPDPGATAGAMERRLRVRRLPQALLRRARGRGEIPAGNEDGSIERIYTALGLRPDVDVVIDSSKLPTYAMLLSNLPDVELYVVHVVRDPRATAFSWRRRKVTNDRDDDATMDQLPLWRSAVLWLLWSLVTDRWWPRQGERSLLVRYEELVSDPRTTVERVLRLVGKELPPEVVEDHRVSLSPTHSVAGNPNRHESGAVELRPDSEWLHAMPTHHQAWVTLLTLPALRRFGYPLRG